jgi:hypothetical protein
MFEVVSPVDHRYDSASQSWATSFTLSPSHSIEGPVAKMFAWEEQYCPAKMDESVKLL